MKPSDELQLAHEYLAAVLERVEHRSGGKARRVDVAAKHLEEWASIVCPPNANGPRGGSSSPVEVEDRVEEARLSSQVSADQVRLRELVRRLVEAARDLDRLVTRNVATRTLKPGEVPEPVKWCRSCERVGSSVPVYHKSRKKGLCEWCWSWNDGWPPVELVEARRQGKRITRGRKGR